MAATRTPRSFGAMIDGKTDDTRAYQSAIDAAGAAGGGDVIVETGTSVVSNLVIGSAGVALVGEASGGYHGYACALKAAAGSSGAMVTIPDGVQHAGVANIRLTGIGDGSATVSRGIDMLGDWCQVSNVTTFYFNDQGITVDGVSNRVVDVLEISCLQNRARQRISGALEVYGTDHYLERIQAGCGYSGLPAGAFPPPLDLAAQLVCGVALLGANCFVSAVHGEAADCGIRIAGTGGFHRLVNCRGDFVSGHGWIIENGMNQLTGCLAQSIGQAQTPANPTWGNNQFDGFYLGATSAGNILTSCQQYDTKAAGARYGFNDAVNSSSPAARNDFVKCRSTNARTAAFNVNPFLGSSPNGTAVRVPSVANERVIDVQGGSPMVIDLRNYSAGTRVTGFKNGANTEIRLIGSPNVTLAFDAKALITNTRADKTLTKDLIYRFSCMAGVWLEDA